MTAWFRPGFLGSMLVLSWTGAAGAQPGASLEQLKPLSDAASTVIVVDARGREVRGTIADASSSQLLLRVGKTIHRFPAADVRTIRVRKDDSLADGAVIGALVGGGSVAFNFLDNECHDDPACYAAVFWCAGIGAFAGLGIDALVRDEAVVYSAGAPRAAQALRVAPLAGRGRKGVRLTIAF
jgi:hypothetical protein